MMEDKPCHPPIPGGAKVLVSIRIREGERSGFADHSSTPVDRTR